MRRWENVHVRESRGVVRKEGKKRMSRGQGMIEMKLREGERKKETEGIGGWREEIEMGGENIRDREREMKKR